jgi:hypothetical protein
MLSTKKKTDCISLQDGSSYVRSDTSIDCNTSSYKTFVILDGLLISIYQSIPLLWFGLLWSIRHKLNNDDMTLNENTMLKRRSQRKKRQKFDVTKIAETAANIKALSTDMKEKVKGRENDATIRHLAFLWQV